ncbi:Cys-Gln thioester bond-forming surface protein [Streptomyces albidoflavus]|uniref:Cys-Gln thioester bond-forming surface protein n=1 Tax=Streptomyces albidoflavus TaxID=1886 RepID=UPI0034269FA2
MFSVRSRAVSRLAAATVASGLVAAGVLTGAGTAVADEAAAGHPGGASATLSGLKTYDQAVIHGEGRDQKVSAGLFEMVVDGGGSLQTYCIDIHNPTQKEAKYRETAWDATSLNANKDAGKIRWILQNSYPQVNDLAALASKAGAGALTEKTAAAGTQVAIWRYSDGADVEALDPAAEKLADYLEQSAQALAEPKASLTLDPPAVSGKAGEKLGPVTVHTDAGSVSVTGPADASAGVTVVDEAGKPVTEAADGSRLFFDVPATEEGAEHSGSAALTVQASTTVPVGRAFASDTKSQTQILAGSSESTVSATATAHWAGKGAIPAVSAEKNCSASGIDLTASNQGDEDFTFELMGVKHTIGAGRTQTFTVPLKEDQAYDFTITGPNGFEKRVTGVLDCKTAGETGAGGGAQPSSEPSPASAGSTPAGGAGEDLAATGGSSATPVIGGIAVALVVIGGATVFLLRRKKVSAES